MKARIVPIYFETGRDLEFDIQLSRLRRMLSAEVEFLEPVALGSDLPDCEAALFPQLLGEAYRQADCYKALHVPVLVITSEFGTMAMWDWEICSYLREIGVNILAPYNLEQAKHICRALGAKRALKGGKFIVFQDNPGSGYQPEIFKRFYWWEDECTQRMLAKFGLTIEKRSFKEFGAAAKNIPDRQVALVVGNKAIPCNSLTPHSLNSAGKIYIAVQHELAGENNVLGVGINCLNESHFSDSTPCLAFNLLYEEQQLIWGCEADTLAMLTKYIVHKSLNVPIMMTNLYPFLMDQAALKHERIAAFPEMGTPAENHVLLAHCGYLGVLPQSFAIEWCLRPRVLAIVDEDACAIDARLPIGDATMVKLGPNLDKITVIEGELCGYAQFPGSDCLNGGVMRVADGHKLMRSLTSHHTLLTTGHNLNDLEFIAPIFDIEIEVL
jgi:hypothetical protein